LQVIEITLDKFSHDTTIILIPFEFVAGFVILDRPASEYGVNVGSPPAGADGVAAESRKG
jgi:hypothetical protein